MGFLYIFFILVCGFIVANYHLPTRFRQGRSTGWDYYFRIGLLGLWCVVFGFIVTILLDILNLPSTLFSLAGYPLSDVRQAWLNFGLEEVTSHQLSVAAFSLIGALLFAIYSHIRARNKVFRVSRLASECSGHHLEKLLLDATVFNMSVSVTLKSRKWYAGKVVDFTPETGGVRSFALLPMKSGYRRESDLQLVDTQDYEAYYRFMGMKGDHTGRLDLEHFRVVIPVEHISHIAMFDQETYEIFTFTRPPAPPTAVTEPRC